MIPFKPERSPSVRLDYHVYIPYTEGSLWKIFHDELLIRILLTTPFKPLYESILYSKIS